MVPEDRDSPERVKARSSQEDPWVMYLIVRSDVTVSERAVLTAAVEATLRAVARFAESPAWSEAFRAWAERSFRKVTLRARGSAWTRLTAYDAGEGRAEGETVVLALPPRRRSECDSLVRNLQVYNPDRATMATDAGEGAPTSSYAMTFVFNARAVMSVGKSVAQISHAVLLCAWSPFARDAAYAEGFEAWEREGYPVRIAPSAEWDALRARPDACVVRDAGLTEVDPGTETVLAIPPGAASK